MCLRKLFNPTDGPGTNPFEQRGYGTMFRFRSCTRLMPVDWNSSMRASISSSVSVIPGKYSKLTATCTPTRTGLRGLPHIVERVAVGGSTVRTLRDEALLKYAARSSLLPQARDSLRPGGIGVRLIVPCLRPAVTPHRLNEQRLVNGSPAAPARRKDRFSVSRLAGTVISTTSSGVGVKVSRLGVAQILSLPPAVEMHPMHRALQVRDVGSGAS